MLEVFLPIQYTRYDMIPHFVPDSELWFFKKQTNLPSPLYPFLQFGNNLNFDINSLAL